MSKYLNEDSRKHHYESTIESTHLMLARAMRMYQKLFDITKAMLIQIENNMYNKAVWNEGMKQVNQYVDSMETIANYGGTNGKN